MEMIHIGLIFLSDKFLGILWKRMRELEATLLITQASRFFPYLLSSSNKKNLKNGNFHFIQSEFYVL